MKHLAYILAVLAGLSLLVAVIGSTRFFSENSKTKLLIGALILGVIAIALFETE